MRAMTTAVVIAAAWAAACGSDDKKKEEPKDAPPLPTVAIPAVGVESARDFNYPYEAGAKAYGACAKAYEQQDWPAVKAACEEAIGKDAGHLHAHRALGVALAQLGEAEAATTHLVTAVAADYLAWGPTLPQDEDLRDYLGTPHGKALLNALLEIKAAVDTRIAAGPWLLARRSTFKWPRKAGYASTRGELYAYDEASKRMIRLTHTDHTLAAWLPAPGGEQLALVGFDKAASVPKDRDKDATLVRAWVSVVDARTFDVRVKKAVFDKVRAVEVSFGPGGQVLVDTFKAQGRWAAAPVATYTIDPSTGKPTRTKGAADPASGRARVSIDESVVIAAPRELKGTPAPQDPALISELTVPATGRTMSLPLSGLGDAAVPRVNPAGTWVAFSTWADPCAEDEAGKPTLFAADATSMQLEHILTADARFGLRWLDDARLIYEDGSGGLRIWDATTRREVAKIGDKLGVALHGLSAGTMPICRQEKLAVEPDDGADEAPVDPPPPDADDALPPEEEPGPVTKPS